MPKRTTIRDLRKALGMSQETFGRAVGKSYASIRTYEDGRKVPPTVMGRMLSLANKAGLRDLFNEIETWAAELYDHPIEPQSQEELSLDTESPADREQLHALLDYSLDNADAATAQALRETIRVFFRAARCVSAW